MSTFDLGPRGVFRDLCEDPPDAEVYGKGFRTQWGPIFYRGRLTGSARVLIIGQDPAQHEAVLRRIFAGEAGRRVQGFLRKLGMTRRYVMINTYLYGIYNQSLAFPYLADPAVAAYRHRWLDAILAPGRIEAVVTFGAQAHQAWELYRTTPGGQAVTAAYAHVLHPTSPGHGQPVITVKKMLQNWNAALSLLWPQITHRDVTETLMPYGEDFADGDRPEIPAEDLPPGTPDWMRSEVAWALMADPHGTQRANITVQVP